MLKSKKFWMFVAILVILPFTIKVNAQTSDTVRTQARIDTVHVTETAITGYIMFDPAVNAGDDHTLRFATLKTAGVINDYGTWQVQYDFANMSLGAAQGEFTRNALGGKVGLYIGRVFTAAGQITPAPDGLYAPNWSSVYLPFTFIGDGIGAQYTYKSLDLYTVSNQRVSAAGTFKGFEALWEDSIGTELGYTTPFSILALHPSFKVLFFDDKGTTQHATSNWIDLGSGIRYYQLVKWGRTQEASAGLTLDVQNVRLKAFYNTHAKNYFGEVVFSF